MFGRLDLLDRILDGWRSLLGDDLAQYRNRAYRIANLALLELPDVSEDELVLLQVAAAFQGIEGVMDGMASERACAWMSRHPETGRIALTQKQAIVSRMLAHRKADETQGEVLGRLVKAFRKAVLIDNAHGFRRYGLARAHVQAIRAAFPDRRACKSLAEQDFRQVGRMLLTLWFALGRRS